MTISQREAHRLRKRVALLEGAIEAQRRMWGQEYVNGTHIGSCQYASDAQAVVAVRTARKLRHAVVVVGDDSGVLRLVALPHPRVFEE